MRRWLVRFGYDGSPFAGWARQPGLVTVEGTILRGWAATGGPVSPGLEVASRTDRGVSAVGNALTLRSDLDGIPLLRRLNGIHPSLFFTAARVVAEEFRLRAADRRTYRYYEAHRIGPLARWRAAATLMSGRIDVRSVGRAIPADPASWRDVEYVRVRPYRGGLCIEVAARSFVWGMVRKMIGALRLVDRGQLDPERLARALAGSERLALPLAEPDGLVLHDVHYPVRWSVRWDGPNRYQQGAWSRARDESWVRSQVVDRLGTAAMSGPARRYGP